MPYHPPYYYPKYSMSSYFLRPHQTPKTWLSVIPQFLCLHWDYRTDIPSNVPGKIQSNTKWFLSPTYLMLDYTTSLLQVWTGAFQRASPLDGRDSLFLLLENHLKKRFGVATYFCFILKGKNKIRKKNPKCDS